MNKMALNKVEELIDSYNPYEALKLLLEFSPINSMERLLQNFYFARVYYLLAENAKALEHIKEAIKSINELEGAINTHLINEVFIEYGKILRRVKRHKEAIQIYEDLLKKESELKEIQLVKILNNLGNCYLELGDFKACKALFDNALKVSNNIKDERTISIILSSLGSYYYFSGNIEKAIEFFEQSYKIRKEINEPLLLATLELNLGSAYSSLFEYEKAIEFLKLALEHFTVTNHKKGIEKTKSILSNVYLNKHDYKSVISLFSEILSTDKIEVLPQNYDNLLKLITSLIQLNEITKAKSLILMMLRDVENKKDDPKTVMFKGQLKHLLATILTEEQEYDEALKILADLEIKAKELHDDESLLAIYFEKGQILMKKEEKEKAKSVFKSARRLAKRLQSNLLPKIEAILIDLSKN